MLLGRVTGLPAIYIHRAADGITYTPSAPGGGAFRRRACQQPRSARTAKRKTRGRQESDSEAKSPTPKARTFAKKRHGTGEVPGIEKANYRRRVLVVWRRGATVWMRGLTVLTLGRTGSASESESEESMSVPSELHPLDESSE